jgi:TldD protein
MSRTRRAVLAAWSVAALVACRPRVSDKPPNPAVWGDPSTGAGVSIPIERSPAPTGQPAPVLDVLAAEVARNLDQLKSEDREVPAYFLAYDLVARDHLWLEAQQGQVVRTRLDTDRTVDIDVRVGSPQLDNSHSLGGNYGPGNGLGNGDPVAIQDEPLALSQALWLLTERQYRDALVALSAAESGEQLRSQDDAKPPSPDFSEEKPLVHVEPRAQLDLQKIAKEWEPRLREASQAIAADARVLESNVVLLVNVDNRHFVDSGGSKVQASHTRLRKDELVALRSAPLAEPYAGPAVLAGRAAGVFFHEIFGHRLEGHRQKDDMEGQTFSGMIGKRVLPTFLDIVDDPTAMRLGGVPLSGHYYVDDEAVAARRTVLVEKGKLRGFLLGRSPVLPFKQSNGHGRRERGNQVVARQGNLIVTSRKTIPDQRMRQALIDEARRQGKPYGLWFSDIQGGYTITERSGPQAFKVMPLLVYRIWADGRPDELVRGVDIVGTPIAAFETIIATGDKPGIFNGMCGAESGDVPVSAVSPALLLRSLEIERASHDRDKPPLLPPPPDTKPVPGATDMAGGTGSKKQVKP